MVVLGVAPGLHALAYGVIAIYPTAELAEPIDWDVLHGGRGSNKPQNFHAAAKRSRIHHMILGVICERHTPAVLALGPALSSSEPREHVDGVCHVVKMLGQGVGMKIVELSDRRAMLEALGRPADSLKKVVSRSLRGGLGSNDRRVVLALATALGAARSIREEVLHVKHQTGT